MADKEYVIDNPDNPVYASMYQPIPLYDDEGNPLTDELGRHRCKLICVNGGASVTAGNVKSAILTAFSRNRVTIKEIQQELIDLANTLSTNVDSSKQEVLTDVTNRINTIVESITDIQNSINDTINNLDTKLTTSDTNIQTDLSSKIEQAKNELNNSINAVKTTVNSVSSAKVSKAGDTMTGQLAVPSIKINGHTITVG
jgi:cob(I)alamin adenosyltransferase